MIIDVHGHLTAPPELYSYKSSLLSSRGYQGHRGPSISDEMVQDALSPHIEKLQEVGTDLQLLSPRPFQLMHSEEPYKIVEWFVRANNDLIHRQTEMHPGQFRGVGGLPQSPHRTPQEWLPEVDRCIKELGFVGVMINPDPAEGLGGYPPMGHASWYPLYERMVELNVPGLIHAAGCRNDRESYSNHFITEGSIALLSLINEGVLQRFPDLKLVISHGGGSVPYQIGRWRAWRIRQGESPESFLNDLRAFHFDSVLYDKASLSYLIKTVGPDRVMFGTERPGSGSSFREDTGRWMDDLKPEIESIDWLSDADRRLVFEQNAKDAFRLNFGTSH